MTKVKTLLAALFSAALIALSLVSLAPKAQAADLNQCAGTMEDKGSSFNSSLFRNITFPLYAVGKPRRNSIYWQQRPGWVYHR